MEITTFRKEGFYKDRRHPSSVEFTKNLSQDAKRRDFTINALYLNLETKEVIDETGGLKDLRARLIRFVGNPRDRIDEDSLRMLRAVRIATQLGLSAKSGPASGWKIEKKSFAAIKTRAKFIQDVSGERIKGELDKILLSQNRCDGIRLLDSSGLLQFIIPEISALKKFSHDSKEFHLEGNMFEHTLLALEKAPFDPNLAYAILFHDIAKPMKAKKEPNETFVRTKGHAEAGAEIFRKFANKIKFTRKNLELIEWAIAKHMDILRFNSLSEEEQARLALQPNIEFLMLLSKADDEANLRYDEEGRNISGTSKNRKAAEKFLKKVRPNLERIKQFVDGHKIMRLSNLKPGQELGQTIDDVKVQIVLGKIKNTSELKNYLQK